MTVRKPSQPSAVPSQGEADASLGDLVTIRDWLRRAVSRFRTAGISYGHGTATAVDEAAFLILETLRLPHDTLEPWLDARLTMAERASLREIIERRIETRKPASYLTGSAYIQGHRFRVDERVIVPRSYIGELILAGRLDDLVPEGDARILDLCTGSGCLAILAALRFPLARVDAVELSADALDVAKGNVDDYGLSDRIELLGGDLLCPVAGRRYDLIIANPPYVAAAEVAAFPPEHAAEPTSAHLGGTDGLDLVRRILAGAAGHLTDAGTLVMEVGTGREILERDLDLPFIWLDTEESEGEVLMLGTAELAQRKLTRGRKRGDR